jgi:hypothetical protein
MPQETYLAALPAVIVEVVLSIVGMIHIQRVVKVKIEREEFRIGPTRAF